ncbi:unnamed protein product [Linum tenue]|uniref:Uncharacterized protein n=1 Tax=Linum tenue TaxID=586396 RepID=A0AAV0MMK8_9ROSI|nr:unnamed protein product [Linum tenue]
MAAAVTQGCHVAVAAIWAHRDDAHTVRYCGPENIDSMHKLRIDSRRTIGDADVDLRCCCASSSKNITDLAYKRFSLSSSDQTCAHLREIQRLTWW